MKIRMFTKCLKEEIQKWGNEWQDKWKYIKSLWKAKWSFDHLKTHLKDKSLNLI